ncbi:tail fiber protein [Pseudomonas phage SCYZ1]|nr:tail fiber protein [Pseudomonas phage SCYZ1]
MALESATTINQLREEYPTGLDPKNQGDDHLRLIKGAIKRTFPNVTGVVNASHEQLNGLLGAGVTNMPGIVAMWGYDAATVPAGWKICNGVGTLRDGRAVPDLRNRFVVAATGTYTPGQVGGGLTHTHEITVAGHVLTEAQMPSHTHNFNYINTPTSQDRPGIGAAMHYAAQGWVDGTRNQKAGGDQAHAHGASAKVADHTPPFYAIIFIIKD